MKEDKDLLNAEALRKLSQDDLERKEKEKEEEEKKRIENQLISLEVDRILSETIGKIIETQEKNRVNEIERKRMEKLELEVKVKAKEMIGKCVVFGVNNISVKMIADYDKNSRSIKDIYDKQQALLLEQLERERLEREGEMSDRLEEEKRVLLEGEVGYFFCLCGYGVCNVCGFNVFVRVSMYVCIYVLIYTYIQCLYI